MFPGGHARNTVADLKDILNNKFEILAKLAVENPKELVGQFSDLASKSGPEMQNLYDCEIQLREPVD